MILDVLSDLCALTPMLATVPAIAASCMTARSCATLLRNARINFSGATYPLNPLLPALCLITALCQLLAMWSQEGTSICRLHEESDTPVTLPCFLQSTSLRGNCITLPTDQSLLGCDASLETGMLSVLKAIRNRIYARSSSSFCKGYIRTAFDFEPPRTARVHRSISRVLKRVNRSSPTATMVI